MDDVQVLSEIVIGAISWADAWTVLSEEVSKKSVKFITLYSQSKHFETKKKGLISRGLFGIVVDIYLQFPFWCSWDLTLQY